LPGHAEIQFFDVFETTKVDYSHHHSFSHYKTSHAEDNQCQRPFSKVVATDNDPIEVKGSLEEAVNKEQLAATTWQSVLLNTGILPTICGDSNYGYSGSQAAAKTTKTKIREI